MYDMHILYPPHYKSKHNGRCRLGFLVEQDMNINPNQHQSTVKLEMHESFPSYLLEIKSYSDSNWKSYKSDRIQSTRGLFIYLFGFSH
jgi:hypothetical protein